MEEEKSNIQSIKEFIEENETETDSENTEQENEDELEEGEGENGDDSVDDDVQDDEGDDDDKSDEEDEIDEDAELNFDEKVDTTDKGGQKKPNKENRAFARMRKEKKELEEKLKNQEGHFEKLDEVARSNGFKSHNEMLEYLENQSVKKEAEKRGVDEADIKKERERETKIEELERKAKDFEKYQINDRVNGIYSEFTSEVGGLTKEESSKISRALSDDGITMEDLHAMSNKKTALKKFFKSYYEEVIGTKENKRNKTLDGDKKRRIDKISKQHRSTRQEDNTTESLFGKIEKIKNSKPSEKIEI